MTDNYYVDKEAWPVGISAAYDTGFESGAEAAEARVAELEAALESALEVMEFAYMNAPKQPKEIGIARAALQQETGRD